MRLIDLHLSKWAQSEGRKPLLVRGARQVGKTFSIDRLGNSSFASFCKINFEEEPEFKAAFEADLSPERILRDLSSRKKIEITPGKTLLFFDEIQACPKALMALRYFYEKLPALHLVAAGSLLEFVLHNPEFSFPVGRVQLLYMRPLSFMEFLSAKGESQMVQWIQTATVEEPIGASTHLALLTLLKEYSIIGGMPHMVYGKTPISEIQAEQRAILEMYSNDFGKYSKYSQQKYLRILFERVPYCIGEHFKFSKIDPDVDARALRTALDLLSRSGLVHRILFSAASGIPLAADSHDKKQKLLFLDIGLLNSRLNVPLDFLSREDLTLVHSGALAEQFVGQELIAASPPGHATDLFYWEREKRGSEAEVDYVLELEGRVIPLEVKAGKTGRLRSLRQFMEEKKAPLGIKVSQTPLALERGIFSVPFYMVSQIARLCASTMY